MECRPGIPGRAWRRWAVLLTAPVVVAVLAHPGVAGADPVTDKRAEAVQIAAQLDAANRRVDQLSEQFDGARLHQQQVQAQLAAAQSDLARTDSQAQAIRARLRGVAIGAYVRSGQPLSVQISSRDLALATVGRTYQDLAAGNQQELLDAARALRATLATDRAQLEAASRDAQVAEAQVTGIQRAAQAVVGNEQALLAQVNGDLATLVAQAEAQHQAQLVAQVAADLAARTHDAASGARPVSAPTAPPPPLLPPPAGPPVVRRNPGPPQPPSPPPPSSRAGTAVATAQAQLGKPYQFGAAGPGSFDCSGLTMYSWAAAGVSLPHYTGAQYAATTHIPLSQLQPGDLVFFYSDLSHVGIYVGGGMMIHAPHTGTVVSYASIFDMATSAIFASRVG